MNKYSFTQDWFSHNIPQWEKQLEYLKNNPVKCMEIGSFEGKSALYLHDNFLTHQDSKLLLIECGMLGNLHKLNENIKLSKSNKITNLTIDSAELVYELGRLNESNKFDFIYIDGSHSSKDVLENAVICFKLLKTGGKICFDDYKWPDKSMDGTSPQVAIDGFIDSYKPYIDILHKGYQVWIQKL